MGTSVIELKIVSIKEEVPGTKTFQLEAANGTIIPYREGQFLTLVFPDRRNEKRRSYSISSSYTLGEPLAITVKRVENGEFSRYLFEKCAVGSSLFTIGASGFFVLPLHPTTYRYYSFYAAGSGIVPILPLIKVLLSNYQVIVRLTYSNSTPGAAIFRYILESMAAQYKDRFAITWLFSDAKDLMKARLTKTLIEEQVNRSLGFHKEQSLFYMCGPHDYMQMLTITLLREGISTDRIRKENFDTTKPVVREEPPDKESHLVELQIGKTIHNVEVRYPETILAAAKRRGIMMPYSCEAGKCGTCAATCTAGSVWMSYNEVLTDKELNQGRVLTCTSHPVGGDVVIRVDG